MDIAVLMRHAIIMGMSYAAPVPRPEQNKQNEYDTMRLFRSGPKVPVVCCILIAVNILVFVVMHIRYDMIDAAFFIAHGGMYPPAVHDGEWWRLITCLFLHANTYHLMNNMIMLFAVGAFVEEALKPLKFLILYFGCGIGASLASYFYAGLDTGMVSVGASGAIFGILGTLIYIVLRHKGHYARLSWKGMLLLLALSIYYGFASGGIDNAAHLGGLVIGFLLGILLYRKPKYFVKKTS